MGDFPLHLVQAPPRPRFGRVKALLIGVVTLAMCLFLAGAVARPAPRSAAFAIPGMTAVGAPPAEASWAPAPVETHGLSSVATAAGGRFTLHTAGGAMTFLPGVNLGSTTPGHQPGEFSVSAAQYRTWFAAMAWLGLRVVRVPTLHPPAFYRELAAYDRANPDRPLYLMQGVYPPIEDDLFGRAATTAFRRELRDAAEAVRGQLTRTPHPGRPGGTWTDDVTPWLAGWIIGAELDPVATARAEARDARAPAVRGRYFRSTATASPTERWLAARMDELAARQAAAGLSRPIAFVNRPATDPLRHLDQPLPEDDLVQLDADHVRATAAWPAGTFASYHAHPAEPALRAYRSAGRNDPYADYLAALRRHHGDRPTLVTSFGVPSAIGSAHEGPLGRGQGDHSEQEALGIDAGLLRLIKDQGLGGGFLAGWTDEWYRTAWNTARHQDPARRQLWHDPLTSEQHLGLIALDAAGSPDATTAFLLDEERGWPAHRVTARVDEAYLRLRIGLGSPVPGTLTLGFDVLPGLTGPPAPGTANRAADAAFFLDTVSRTGQAYLRRELDPLPLDAGVPVAARGPAAIGWQRFELLADRATGGGQPAELQNAGILRYGDSTADSRALWQRDGDDLLVRVPWAMLGFADPSRHMVGVPVAGKLTLQAAPGVGVTVSATGTDQPAGQVSWVNWNRTYATERLKPGAGLIRDAALETAAS